MGPPDPGRFMDRYVSWEFATKANKWQGRNISRWRHEEYDQLYRAAEVELDPVKRVAYFIRMNDLVVRRATTCCRWSTGRRWRGRTGTWCCRSRAGPTT